MNNKEEKSWCLILFIITIITFLIQYLFYPNIRLDIKIKGYLLHFINTFIKIAFICNILLNIISITHIFLTLYQQSILDENIVQKNIIGLNDDLIKTYGNAKERLEQGIFFGLIDIYKNKPYTFYLPLYHNSNNNEKDILLCLIMGFFLIIKLNDFFQKNCRNFFYNMRSKEILNYHQKDNNTINTNYNVE